MPQHSPVDEDVAATQSGRVYEVIAEWEILRQILIRGVRCYHTQIMLVLQQKDGAKYEKEEIVKEAYEDFKLTEKIFYNSSSSIYS
jgi:hypothetical protein